VAYNEDLADRIRKLLADEDEHVTEKKMFGGLAFLVDGKMAIAASGQGGILVRCDPTKTVSADAQSAIMRGRPTEGWLRVTDDALRTKAQLRKWVKTGTESARLLAPNK
jgi:TfoX/Sxy family transcriptional regulator of competence genes